MAPRPRHGMSNTDIYAIWTSMKNRCTNPNNSRWGAYGGRGIMVCDRWASSFESFYADMGPRPSKEHTLDRIDNNRGYDPDNCRWATRREQQINTRRNEIFVIEGKSYTLRDLCEITGLTKGGMRLRLRKEADINRIMRSKESGKNSRSDFIRGMDHRVTVNGKVFTSRMISEITGLNQDQVRHRLRKGSHFEDIICQYLEKSRNPPD